MAHYKLHKKVCNQLAGARMDEGEMERRRQRDDRLRTADGRGYVREFESEEELEAFWGEVGGR